MSQDCINGTHADAVVEQLEKIIELIQENPDKGVGLKITSIIETPIVEAGSMNETQKPQILNDVNHMSIAVAQNSENSNGPVISASNSMVIKLNRFY